MKRGQMGEADKHAIRRKIEEKQVLIREQRKVSASPTHHTRAPTELFTVSVTKNDSD